MSDVGVVNGYFCDTCSQYTVTIDRAEGVTPMMLACRASGECEGIAVSCMYRPPAECPTKPAWEWYRPDDRELRECDRETLHYVERGGLLLRKIESAASEDTP